MPRPKSPLLVVLLLTLATATPSHAGLTLSIGNLSLNPGDSGTLRVTVASSDSTPVSLDGFAFTFWIIPEAGAQSQLSFAHSQPQPYTDPDYVFLGDSINYDGDPDNPTTLGNVSTTDGPDDTYVGGDFTNDGQARSVTSDGKLLLDLRLTAGTAAPPPEGARFVVSLSPPFSLTGGDADSPSYFTGGGGFIPYATEAGGGLVEVRGGPGDVVATPEPSTVILALSGLAATLAARWLRRG